MTYPPGTPESGSGWPDQQPDGQPPPAYGQPEQPTYPAPDPPTYGQPSYGQPGYGQPAYGQPPSFGGYGPPTPPGYGPPAGGSGRSGNRTAWIIAAVVVVLALVGGGIGFAATRDSGKSSANKSPSPKASASTSSDFGGGAPLATGSATGGSSDAAAPDGPTEKESRTVAERYINDVNTQNKTDALSLICAEAKDEYQASLDKADSDFAFKWTHVDYLGVSSDDDQTTVVSYDVTVTKGGQSKDLTVAFGVVDEGGAKLCSEDAS
jgi:hypothetical protein